MAKKKTKRSKKSDSHIDVDVHVGTPTLALLPATNYVFKVHKKEYKITVPREGKYCEIDPDMFEEEDGEFMLLDEKSKVMYIPAISKVLFAVNKYPKLKTNQLFAPLAFVFKKDEVDIIGQIVEMLDPSDVKTTAT